MAAAMRHGARMAARCSPSEQDEIVLPSVRAPPTALAAELAICSSSQQLCRSPGHLAQRSGQPRESIRSPEAVAVRARRGHDIRAGCGTVRRR